MTEEARQLEPVRMFDDLGDANGLMKDWAPRLVKIGDIEPDEHTLDRVTPNAPGYDPEHGVWSSPEAKKDYLDSLTHPLDADGEHPASADPDQQELPLGSGPLEGKVANATGFGIADELPKVTGTPAPN